MILLVLSLRQGWLMMIAYKNKETKMYKEETRFENVKDMANWVTKNTHNAERRFMLEFTTHTMYLDPEAGKAWEEKYYAIPYPSDDWDAPEYKAYRKAQEDMQESQPETKQVPDWYLVESGDSRFKKYLHLSQDLGEKVNGIWKVTNSRWRGSHRTGMLTIVSILKRLGLTDIGDQVKTAQAQVEAENAKNTRNYHRKAVIELALKMNEHLNCEPKAFNDHLVVRIGNLLRDVEAELEQ
jgi:hypothetical protein